MRLGLLNAPVAGADANAVPEQARRCEAAGFDSFWTAHASGRGHIMTDPFVAMAAAAAVTERIELGTGILQLPLYAPTDVALKAWSVAQVSGGRFRLGIGAGSTEADFLAHGVPFGERFQRFEAATAELRAIFASGDAHGVSLGPWPEVAAGPPLFFGTWWKNAARAAQEFDGWMASGMKSTVEEAEGALKVYREAGGGRAIVTTILVAPDADLGELRARLARYADAGFDDAVLMPLPGAPTLDALRALA